MENHQIVTIILIAKDTFLTTIQKQVLDFSGTYMSKAKWQVVPYEKDVIIPNTLSANHIKHAYDMSK